MEGVMKNFCETLCNKAEELYFTKNNINIEINKDGIYIKDLFYNRKFFAFNLNLENWIFINQITHFIENDEIDVLEGIVDSFRLNNILENSLSFIDSTIMFPSKDIRINLSKKNPGIHSSVVHLPYYEFCGCLYLSPIDFHLIKNKKFWKIGQDIYKKMKEGHIFHDDDYIYNGNEVTPEDLRRNYKENLIHIKKLENSIKEIEDSM